MFIVKRHNDGSCHWGYEPGDKPVLAQDFAYSSLTGRSRRVYPAGMEVTVLSRDRYDPTWMMLRYLIRFPDGTMEYVHKWDLSAHLCKRYKKTPPRIWVVPWRDGRLWKGTRVLTWTAADAMKQFIKQLETWHYSTEKLLHIRVKPVRREDKMQADILARLYWTSPIGVF